MSANSQLSRAQALLTTAGNRELTALTGVLITPLMALVLLTGLAMDTYWHVHYVIGFVLIPVVGLKLASTGYRAASYYLGRPVYHTAGPPELPLRLLAPILAVSTVTALVTGVLLYAEHSRSGEISTLHTDSAVVCAVTVGVHLLAYAQRAVIEAARGLRLIATRAGRLRLGAVVVILAVGIVLAAVTFAGGTWPARTHYPGFRFGGPP